MENDKFLARGLITEEEKVNANISIWNDATKKVQDALIAQLSDFNPIKMMAVSGARGSNVQVNSICGMRGIMAGASGQKVDVPIRSNLRDGLTPLEYFLSSRGWT